METTVDSTRDAQSLSDLEKGELWHEKDQAEQQPNHEKHDAESSPGPTAANVGAKGASTGVNTTDWNGNDDPDNPYNCTKLSSLRRNEHRLTGHLHTQGQRGNDSIMRQPQHFSASQCRSAYLADLLWLTELIALSVHPCTHQR